MGVGLVDNSNGHVRLNSFQMSPISAKPSSILQDKNNDFSLFSHSNFYILASLIIVSSPNSQIQTCSH